MTEEHSTALPTHLGFIVDGNRRWAKMHGLPTYEGHLAGHTVLKDVLREAVQRGIKYVSFYVFSTENWKRSQSEVSYLMKLVLKILRDDLKEIIKEETRVRIIGAREGIPDNVLEAINNAEEQTRHFTRATAVFCFNYGGKLEIADAAKRCVADNVDITPEAIRERLYAADIPDCDMIVRTSGEQRLSNFMLWRAAYSEFLFLEKFWPDMRPEDIDTIVEEYGHRQRRFGGN